MIKIWFSPREDKMHILKPPCNVLFIINNFRPKSVIFILINNAKNLALF